MRSLISILFILFSVFSTMAQNLPSKGTNGKWGFRDESGNWVVKPIFDEYDGSNTFTKIKNFAVVRQCKLWGCVGVDGKFVSKLVFRNMLLAAKAGNEWNNKAERGENIYEAFDIKSQKYGFSDYEGTMLMNPIYEDVDPDYNFFKGKKLSVVKHAGCWGCVDKKGVFVTKPVLVSMEDARMAADEVANYAKLGVNVYDAFDSSNRKWGFVNYKGLWVVRPILDNVDRDYNFGGGRLFAVVKYKGKWGCVNRLSSFIVKPTYANAQAAKNAGFAWQSKNSTVIEPSQLASFDDGKLKNVNWVGGSSSSQSYVEPASQRQNNRTQTYSEPPTIQILTPKDGSDYTTSEMTFTYEVKTADGSAPQILSYVNGELHPRTKGIKRVGNQITLTLPRLDDCRVQLIAKDKNGQNSDPAVVLLHYRGNRPKPNLHVFAVGVSNYDQADLKLLHAAKDAADFTNVIKNMKTSMYVQKKPVLITDKSATDKNIKKGLSSLVNNVEQGDVVMLFFSGHGSKEGGETYFLSCNAESNDLFSSAVNFDAIRTAIKRLKDRKCRILVFMDACHSGALYGRVLKT